MNNSEYQTFLCEYKKELSEGNNEVVAISNASAKLKIKEEDSNDLLVYVGTYKVNKFVTKAMEFLTYDDDPKAKYKRYINVETGNQYNVNIENVKEFEETHNIIYRGVVMNNIILHYQNYLDTRQEFFKGITTEPQEKVVLKLIKKDQR